MQVSVREAREHLSRLLKAVEHGEVIEITRRGRVVARLEPASSKDETGPRADARERLREMLPPVERSSAELIRELRDERG